MKKEEKEILFKDLCARLPYSVLVKTKKYSFPIELRYLTLDKMPDVKPYLRPMSSMTKEEKEEYKKVIETLKWTEEFDFYNKYHFDYRELIPMGLALEAPEGMYHFQKENRDE